MNVTCLSPGLFRALDHEIQIGGHLRHGKQTSQQSSDQNSVLTVEQQEHEQPGNDRS